MSHLKDEKNNGEVSCLGTGVKPWTKTTLCWSQTPELQSGALIHMPKKSPSREEVVENILNNKKIISWYSHQTEWLFHICAVSNYLVQLWIKYSCQINPYTEKQMSAVCLLVQGDEKGFGIDLGRGHTVKKTQFCFVRHPSRIRLMYKKPVCRNPFCINWCVTYWLWLLWKNAVSGGVSK